MEKYALTFLRVIGIYYGIRGESKQMQKGSRNKKRNEKYTKYEENEAHSSNVVSGGAEATEADRRRPRGDSNRYVKRKIRHYAGPLIEQS